VIVRFTRRAEADLEAILSYLADRSPEGARKVGAALRRTIERAADHPGGGASTRRPQILVRIVPTYPYKIFYRVRKDSIDILHIRHSARRPWIA
jgi:toxin ParE1/3/4